MQLRRAVLGFVFASALLSASLNCGDNDYQVVPEDDADASSASGGTSGAGAGNTGASSSGGTGNLGNTGTGNTANTGNTGNTGTAGSGGSTGTGGAGNTGNTSTSGGSAGTGGVASGVGGGGTGGDCPYINEGTNACLQCTDDLCCASAQYCNGYPNCVTAKAEMENCYKSGGGSKCVTDFMGKNGNINTNGNAMYELGYCMTGTNGGGQGCYACTQG